MVWTMGDCCSIFRSIFRPDASGSSTRCGHSANAEDKISGRQSYVRADLGRRGANARIVWTRSPTHKAEPYLDGGEFDEGEVVGVVLFVARRYGTEMFELVEEAFDQVAEAIEVG